MPIALAGSGAECWTSISRRGPRTPDPGGRPTPTACVSASTSADLALAIPPPFHTSRSLTWPRRLSACTSSAALLSTPESGGPSAETLRAALSLWPPRRRPPASPAASEGLSSEHSFEELYSRALARRQFASVAGNRTVQRIGLPALVTRGQGAGSMRHMCSRAVGVVGLALVTVVLAAAPAEARARSFVAVN